MSRAASLASTLLCLLLATGVRAEPPDPSLAQALERAISDGWEHLRIEAECRIEGRLPKVEVFGNGVGIWNEEKQFKLSREAVRSQLLAFREAGFAVMRPSYGGKGDPVTPAKAPPRLTCRVGLSLDGATRQVVQLQGGRQSEELRRLGERILNACRGPAAAGIGAADLEDALSKVAGGVLAPEALRVLVSRRFETRPGGDGARGWVLRVEARTASLQSHGDSGQGLAEARLDEGEISGLARLLREGGMAGLPINLYAEEYTDLIVKVLDREKRVQARRFAGMTRTTHGLAQGRFDRILEGLDDRRQRWFAREPPKALTGPAPGTP